MDEQEWRRHIERAQRFDRLVDYTVSAAIAVGVAAAVGLILWLAIGGSP